MNDIANAIIQASKNSDNLTAITDKDGKIVWINNAFTTTSGYLPEEVIGTNPRILKSGIHNDEFYKDIWGTISSKKQWKGVITNKRKDGTTYRAMTTICPVLDVNEEIEGYISVEQDISLHDKLNEEIVSSEKKLSIAANSLAEANKIFKVISEISEFAVNQEIFNLKGILNIAGTKLKMSMILVQNCHEKNSIIEMWFSNKSKDNTKTDELFLNSRTEQIVGWVLKNEPYIGEPSNLPSEISYLSNIDEVKRGSQLYVFPMKIKQRPWGKITFVNGNGHLWSVAEQEALWSLSRLITVMIEGNWEKTKLLEHISLRFDEIENIVEKREDEFINNGVTE